jgi:gluconokinase
MVFLRVSHDEDVARLTARRGHFFPAALLDSQFAALEMPEDFERVTLLPADDDPATLVGEIIDRLGIS